MRTKKLGSKAPKRTRTTSHVNPYSELSKTAECTLAEFMADEPRLAKFLQAIRVGGSVPTAAGIVRVNSRRVSKWIANGSEGSEGSLERGLYLLVAEAIANASLMGEAAVLSKQPAVYLASSTRAVLSPDSSASLSTSAAEAQRDAAQAAAVPIINMTDLAAALIELHNAGVMTPSTGKSEPALTLDAPRP